MQLFLCLIILYCLTAQAQSVSTQLGGRSAGMGNASATMGDEWSVFNNPGGLAQVEETAIICAYDLRPSLEGANRMGAAFLLPRSYGTMSVAAFKFGHTLYSEHLVSASYGHKVGITSLGVKANYVQYRADLFGSHYAVSFDFGGITKLTPKLSVGCYILNLTQAKLNSQTAQQLPTRMIAGIGYEISPEVRLLTEVEKDLSFVKLNVRNGVEYNFHKKFFIRTGFNFFPSAGFAGIGLHKYGFKIDYAMSYNPILLFTYQTSVVYSLKRRKL